ncbi:MAG: bifunctional 4-hydroxy-2-oxoglutarate aldolase/2-dehydro-3-deoxy-phosphogluconate aldolase [Chelatococcus sp.]|uniref:bifunctional 4-hydroxy-2-oxoglutarate aldolase/2-dehydro-3-deoxy-phosphogluconate aldolase n=1 Tax=Chelatococcus sp. TaxID=1953771 RepID=UPI0025BFBCA6|nr:bifunctional 4-hydroxy-2-oxoglutarate aldolase/2-dehydro-3-deoxy-phosphogluconate aldolase [Chelatococcus sp.]MBX3537728.1 bifunctional 4-hydroxy-2-oxoglutarate aldolase/2-dehydro-3-deoxy-phosphogluconate aldolase [Chelatococcus sp.]
MNRILIARLAEARVMPIVSVGGEAEAIALVDDLVEAGAAAIEILFRHPRAANVLHHCRTRHRHILLAAGTIMDTELGRQAAEAGADFMISPGLTPSLAAFAATTSLPLIPGAQTPSEVMLAAEHGFQVLKFYPAEPNDAAAILKDYANVFPSIYFIPTGGIGEPSLAKYGALPNVLAVGGSWTHGRLPPGSERPAEVANALRRARSLLGAGPDIVAPAS